MYTSLSQFYPLLNTCSYSTENSLSPSTYFLMNTRTYYWPYLVVILLEYYLIYQYLPIYFFSPSNSPLYATLDSHSLLKLRIPLNDYFYSLFSLLLPTYSLYPCTTQFTQQSSDLCR